MYTHPINTNTLLEKKSQDNGQNINGGEACASKKCEGAETETVNKSGPL
jgi:hypothetical protein